MSIFDVYARDCSYGGALYDLSPEARVAQSRQKALSLSYGTELSMKDTLFASSGGNANRALHSIGVETGINKTVEDDNLSFDRYLSSTQNKDDILFQGEDGMLYNLNFSTGAIESESTEEFAEEHGLIEDGDKFYDIAQFGNDSAEFINYEFSGLGDGKQDSVSIGIVDDRWSNAEFVEQEVNPYLFGTTNNSQESSIANKAYDTIKSNTRQWLKSEDYATLNAATTSSEYIQTFINIAIKNLTQSSNVEKTDNIKYTEEQKKAEEEAKAEAEKEAQAAEEEKATEEEKAAEEAKAAEETEASSTAAAALSNYGNKETFTMDEVLTIVEQLLTQVAA